MRLVQCSLEQQTGVRTAVVNELLRLGVFDAHKKTLTRRFDEAIGKPSAGGVVFTFIFGSYTLHAKVVA